MTTYLPHGLPIPVSHERAAETALGSGAELVWFIEEDALPPPDALVASWKTMEATGAGQVAVEYPCGRLGHDGTKSIRWGTVMRDAGIEAELGDGLGPIVFTALGITLIRSEVFDKDKFVKIGSMPLIGNTSKEINVDLPLPMKPKSFAVNLMHDVLAR